MGRRAKIDRFPKEIREQINTLLKEGVTYQEITASLQRLGHDISESAVGRYGQRFHKMSERMRHSRQVAEVWTAQVGALPEGDVGKLMVEIVQTLVMEKAIETGDKPGSEVGLDDLRTLARTIRDLQSANKSSIDAAAKARDEARKAAQKEALDAVDRVAKKAGLSKQSANDIRREILGLGE